MNDEFYFGELRKKDEIISLLKRDLIVQKREIDNLKKELVKKLQEFVMCEAGYVEKVAELEDIKVAVGRRIEVAAQQVGRPVCKNCGLCLDDIGGGQ